MRGRMVGGQDLDPTLTTKSAHVRRPPTPEDTGGTDQRGHVCLNKQVVCLRDRSTYFLVVVSFRSLAPRLLPQFLDRVLR